MKTKWMILATLALALSPGLLVGQAPAKTTQSNGTRTSNQVPDRTPKVHDHSTFVGHR